MDARLNPAFHEDIDVQHGGRPNFFNTPHKSDKYGGSLRARRMPAVVVTMQSDQQSPMVFGNWQHDSMFRFRPSLISQYMVFDINVREGHQHGREDKPPTHEDTLWFDPDTAAGMELYMSDRTLPSALRQTLDGIRVIPQQGMYGVIVYRVGKERPQRGLGRNKQEFPAGSQGAAFFQHSPDTYIIICQLQGNDAATWEAYDTLINAVRTASRHGNATMDWHFSHDPLFDENFSAYIKNCDLELRELTWLRTNDGRNFMGIYPGNEQITVDANNLPVAVFPSIKNYIRHFIPALLMERKEDMRQTTALYNSSREHHMLFNLLHPGSAVCHIRINKSEYEGSLVIPFTATSVKIQLPAIGDGYDNGYLQLEGKVWGAKRDGYDFMVQTNAPEQVIDRMKAMNVGHDDTADGEWDAVIELVYSNNDIQQKLQHLTNLRGNRPPKLQKIDELPVESHRRRGKFELRSIIGEYGPRIWSPAFREEYQNSNIDAGVKARTLQVVDHLIMFGRFDDFQRRFIRACIEAGVPGNIAILQGLPGSGKSSTLAYVVLILMLFDKKVIITGQSNAAPDALLEKVRDTIEAHKTRFPELAQLLKRITRLQSPTREGFNMESLAVNLDHPNIDPDCMAARVLEHVRAQENQEDQDVIDFHRHMEAEQNGQKYTPAYSADCKYPANRGLSAVTSRIHTLIVSRMLLIAATTFAASSLENLNYRADIVIVDEAAQATEPDVIGVLLTQPNVVLAILAGDEQQFGPVVKSLQARSNPWAGVLSVPLMVRLLAAYPHVERYTLVSNYRSHPTLIYMPSRVFYNGKMQVGSQRPDHWWTQLDRGIHRLLSSRNIFPHDHRRTIRHRQIFFDVDGLPVKYEGGHSISNPNGVRAVADAALMCLQIPGIKAGDIGVITHYGEDKQRLRYALATHGIDIEVDVETATVDAFQGKEKQIILIHFVVANDGPNPFGFVSNSKRLCVGVTRAKRLQLMFGNLTFWEQATVQARRLINDSGRHAKMLKVMEYVRDNDQVVNWENVHPLAEATGEGRRQHGPRDRRMEERDERQRQMMEFDDIDDEFQ